MSRNPPDAGATLSAAQLRKVLAFAPFRDHLADEDLPALVDNAQRVGMVKGGVIVGVIVGALAWLVLR